MVGAPSKLVRAVELGAPPSRSAEAALSDQVEPGKIVEISSEAARGRTSTAVSLLIQAQHRGEPCAWIQPSGGRLYPPDLAAAGVDLDALVVVHVPRGEGSPLIPRAAELLLRSGAFGLVVLDLLDGAPRGDGAAWQGRLGSLAREHESIVILLTRSASARGSLGPLVSLRVAPARRRIAPDRFELGVTVLKNKAGLVAQPPGLIARGPYGLE